LLTSTGPVLAAETRLSASDPVNCRWPMKLFPWKGHGMFVFIRTPAFVYAEVRCAWAGWHSTGPLPPSIQAAMEEGAGEVGRRANRRPCHGLLQNGGAVRVDSAGRKNPRTPNKRWRNRDR